MVSCISGCDTCCIDKSSSAELSEAINSMFRWYKNSDVCFALLSDLAEGKQADTDPAFGKCRWWTRGWTLQELIAPPNVIFVDQEWNVVGTKVDLGEVIESITGVSQWVLNGLSPISAVPLAKRMSWAANRDTTRVEDKAYCLLGIFDVNIPMIYGEGATAFIRLQEAILNKTTDLSIFAWQAASDDKEYRGILAESPSEFQHCGFIELSDDQFRFRDEISFTNMGVKIRTPVQYMNNGTFVMDLHCYDENPTSGTSKRLGIYLRRALDTYYRYRPDEIAPTGVGSSSRSPRSIFLASLVDESAAEVLATEQRCRRIYFEFPGESDKLRVSDIRAVPETFWEDHEQYFTIREFTKFTCFVRFSVTSRIVLPTGMNSEETTSFIVVCDLTSGPDFRVSIYAQTGLQSSSKSREFIDPFDDINHYGPLGDAFSLSILRPGEREDRKVQMIHKDPRHNYAVSATVSKALAPSFMVSLTVSSQDTDEMDRPMPRFHGYGAHPKPGRPPSPDDKEYHNRRMAAVSASGF